LPMIAVIAAFAIAPPDKGNEFAIVGVAFAVGGLAFLGGCGAQIYAQLTWGQSIGKRLTGIKVVRRDGSPIELWRLILMRNLLLGVFNTFCNLAGLVDALMIFTQDQRCLHDYLADSIVIDTGPSQPPQ
jgi:uncharacterized RDD family membrane protein YckC